VSIYLAVLVLLLELEVITLLRLFAEPAVELATLQSIARVIVENVLAILVNMLNLAFVGTIMALMTISALLHLWILHVATAIITVFIMVFVIIQAQINGLPQHTMLIGVEKQMQHV
jgi:hypothetical protein